MYCSIRKVVERTGLCASAIRFYDQNDLLPSLQRSEGGTRRFSEEDIVRLKQIEALKNAGFSIAEIKIFFAAATPPEKKRALLTQKAETLRACLAFLTEQMQQLPPAERKRTVVKIKPKN